MKSFSLWLVIFVSLASGYSEAKKRLLTPAEVKSVIQAVEDEIYDSGKASEFFQMGDNIGTPQHWKARMRIYINPEFGGEYDGNQGLGEAMYKFMPSGQVLRYFDLRSGKAILVGDWQDNFPPTQPSHRTVFDDEEVVCARQRVWLKQFFVIDTKPSDTIIDEAGQRQKLRQKSAND